MKRFGFVIAPIAIILIAGLIIYYLFPDDPQIQGNIRFEVIKFLIQLILIIFLGGILVHEYNRGRDRARALNDFRKTTLANLRKAYFSTKKVRRVLDASIVPNLTSKTEEINYSIYSEQMRELIDAQLEFESHEDQLKTFNYAFKGIANLKTQAEDMAGYLNNVIDEYQKLKTMGNINQQIDVSNLPKLKGFIYTQDFRAEFADKFHSTVELIEQDILRI